MTDFIGTDINVRRRPINELEFCFAFNVRFSFVFFLKILFNFIYLLFIAYVRASDAMDADIDTHV